MAGARAAAGRAQALVALAEGDAPTRRRARAGRRRGGGGGRGHARGGARPARRRPGAASVDDRAAGVAQLPAGGSRPPQLRCAARRGRGAAASCAAPACGSAAAAPAPRAREGLDALSPREHEIAELVAEGLTNREIGARLFLSEKTIETHLTHVFQKLGLRSRAQVAAEVSRRAAAQ